MNLQENIDRIHEIMGVINEDNRPNVFKKMIDEIGIYDTIKVVGSYKDMLKHIDYEEITNDNKIKFIQKVVNIKSDEWNTEGLSIYETDLSSVLLDKDGNIVRHITYFGKLGVSIRVYDNNEYISNQSLLYEELPKDVLNKIFIIMLKYLEIDLT